MLDLCQYSKRQDDLVTEGVGSKAFHEWFFLGARGVFDIRFRQAGERQDGGAVLERLGPLRRKEGICRRGVACGKREPGKPPPG